MVEFRFDPTKSELGQHKGRCVNMFKAQSRIGRLRDGNPDIEGDSEVQPTPMFLYSTESMASTSVQIVLSSKWSKTVNIWLNSIFWGLEFRVIEFSV